MRPVVLAKCDRGRVCKGVRERNLRLACLAWYRDVVERVGCLSSRKMLARVREVDRQNAACSRINDILRELREKYRIERAEIVSSVTDRVSDLRTELDSARFGAKECCLQVEHIRNHLSALETAHDGSVDLQQATTEANRRLNLVLDGLSKMGEEAQVLKSAVLNDRMQREARERRSMADDDELEIRIRHLEETNAALRSELHVVKSVNTETNEAVVDLVRSCKIEVPTSSAASELHRLRDDVLRDLLTVREAHDGLRTKFESTMAFCRSEEQRRQGRVGALEASVAALERRNPAPSYAAVVDTGLLGSAGLVVTPRRDVLPVLAGATSYEPQKALPFKEKIAEFYRIFNPAKSSGQQLESVLREYEGAEAELMAALEVHYNAFGYFTS